MNVIRKIIIILILSCVIIFLYGRFIEINNLKINEYTLSSESIPQSFNELKIVHFSDILYSQEMEKNLEKVVDKINDENADIVIFSGDLFKKGTSYSEDDYKNLEKYFSKIKSNLYKFAVIGENDNEFLNNYKDILNNSDFTLLDNQNMLFFYKDNTPINIVGITEVDDVANLFNPDVEVNYTLVITHKPDNIQKLSSYNINTILSGHSLGGIIKVPFVGGIIKKDGATMYLNNYYKVGNTDLYISNGLGFESYNFRLFNTPSINVYRFSVN